MQIQKRSANMKKFKFNMASHSSFQEIPFGAAKLCQDIATLLNNRQGSDIQFKVGGDISTQGNSDNPTIVTLYAHSLILRCRSSYFAAMLDEEKNWKESSSGVIYKPNISPTTFQDVLYYLYTGNVRTSGNIMELIAAADEMDLEEISTECQNELIRTVRCIFTDEGESAKEHIPINVAIRTHIIPALNLASTHSLSNISQELLTIILPHMSVIIKSPGVYTTFINGISSESLIKIISSDDLEMTERSVCDLAIDWACCQTNLSKTAIEACSSNLDYEEEDNEEEPSDDRTVISYTQLKQFKKILTPLLPAIRFSLLDPNEYRSMINTLSYILPPRRYLEINEYFLNPDGTGLLDAPRIVVKLKLVVESKIVVETTAWDLLRKNIFETVGIAGCRSLYHLKFELLFRASDHGFYAATFHQRCDNKGPTLVIVRSSDGHLFGGVNFKSWESSLPGSYSPSTLNFLFALPDGRHRKDSEIFKIKKSHSQYSSYNHISYGPSFGGTFLLDLRISDSADTKSSFSSLPYCYDGSGASETALAGSEYFIVSDYEVFAISK